MDAKLESIKKSLDNRCKKLSKFVFDAYEEIDAFKIIFERKEDDKISIRITSFGIRDSKENPFYDQKIIIKPKIERKMNPTSIANLKQNRVKKQQELLDNTVVVNTEDSVMDSVGIEQTSAQTKPSLPASNNKKKNNKKSKKSKKNKKNKKDQQVAIPIPELELVENEKKKVEEERRIVEAEKAKVEVERRMVEEEKKSLKAEIKRLNDEKIILDRKEEKEGEREDREDICKRCLDDIEAEKKIKIKKYMISKPFKEEMVSKGHKKVLRSFYGIHKKFEDLVNESLANETKSSYDNNKELNDSIFYVMNNKINFVRKKLDYRTNVIKEYASIYNKYLLQYTKKEGEMYLYRALQELGFFIDDDEVSKLIEEMRRSYEYVHVFESLNKEFPRSEISPSLLFKMGSEFGEFLSKIKDEILHYDDVNQVRMKEIEKK